MIQHFITCFIFAFLLFGLNDFVLYYAGLVDRIDEDETKKQDRVDAQLREEELRHLKEDMESETPIENYI